MRFVRFKEKEMRKMLSEGFTVAETSMEKWEYVIKGKAHGNIHFNCAYCYVYRCSSYRKGLTCPFTKHFNKTCTPASRELIDYHQYPMYKAVETLYIHELLESEAKEVKR